MANSMDEKLILLKKNKPIKSRCVLTNQNEFVLFEPNGKNIKMKFKLEDCEKISRYQDNSWEITHKSGKSFHFLGDKNNSNKWFDAIYSLFTNELQGKDDSFNISNNKSFNILDGSHINEDNIYDVSIDKELTHQDLLSKLKSPSYCIQINESGICLKGENEESHMFEASSIKKYGSTSDCFAFELGRKSKFGCGLIALQSKKYNSKVVYDHFNELAEQCFYSLREKLLREDELNPTKKTKTLPINRQQEILQQKDEPSLQWFTPSTSLGSDEIPVVSQIKSEFSDSDITAENASHLGSISDSIDSYSSVEIPIIVEDRPRKILPNINFRNIKSSMNSSDLNNTNTSIDTFNGDETLTFYEDKYIPEYMSNTNLVSKPMDFFEDSDNLVYARVKL